MKSGIMFRNDEYLVPRVGINECAAGMVRAIENQTRNESRCNRNRGNEEKGNQEQRVGR